jgi:hypothetical protein
MIHPADVFKKRTTFQGRGSLGPKSLLALERKNGRFLGLFRQARGKIPAWSVWYFFARERSGGEWGARSGGGAKHAIFDFGMCPLRVGATWQRDAFERAQFRAAF